MINFEFSNKAFESQFVPLVEEAYAEASGLLGGVPTDTLRVQFKQGADETTGVGGFTHSEEHINLTVLEGYEDSEVQRGNLRGTVFHEALHAWQGFTYEKAPFTALEAAIYEGCALVFERQYAGAAAAYGDYSQYSEEELGGWLDEIRSIGTAYYEDTTVWQEWASYHPKYEQKWLIYKVGSWFIDRTLNKNQLDLLDLKDMTADQIISLGTA